MCNPYEKQGKQNLCILFTFSRVCGPPFDDPKGRWRRGGGINVPIILKFSKRRAEALNVKELVRQTGIVVTLSRDNENCFAKAGTTKTGGKQAQHVQALQMTREMTWEITIYWTIKIEAVICISFR